MKKRPLGELAFVFGTLFSAIGISIQVNTDLGISMVAAPAYLLSLKIPWLSLGMAECFVQGLLYVWCCLLTQKILYKKLWSFIVAIPYGVVLNCVMAVLKPIHANHFIERIGLFLIGSIILALGIALFFRTYLPCQVYEMFVKTLAEYKDWNCNMLKIVYDWSSLLIAVILSICFFRRLVGIGIGTLLCTVVNGPLVVLWGKILDQYFNFAPALKSRIVMNKK